MNFESMETTRKSSRPKQIETEDTQVARPIETAETVLRKPEKIAPAGKPEKITVKKGPDINVPPKTERQELEELLESLGDEEEATEQAEKLREEITGKPAKKAPFLEREVSEEKKQERFLENLTIALKETRGARDIDRDELDKIMEDSGTDYLQKIKKFLHLAKANKIPDIQNREKIFNMAYKEIKAREQNDVRRAFEEVSEMSIPNDRKQQILSKKMNEIKDKYNIEGLFKYLKLGEKEGGTVELE